MEAQKEKALVVNTVEEIKRNFTKKELEKADEARRLYVIVGRPSRKQLEEIIKSRKIINNMIMVQDYRNALQIYGIDLGVLKGKTVRAKPNEMKVQFFEGPNPKNIILSIDIMYVSGLTFLITVSRNIIFITGTILLNRKKDTIMGAIQQVLKIYKGKGHEVKDLEFITEESSQDQSVHTILADNEFQVLQDKIEEMGINVNIVTKMNMYPKLSDRIEL